MDLTLARLKELLHYDPETGAWIRIVNRAGAKAGARAEAKLPNGYRQVVINRKRYLAHRLAWLYVHGHWPSQDIDHIDGDRANNRIANLREATRSQNIFATRRTASNQSGLRGVKRVNNRWRAQIRIDGTLRHLGYFDEQQEARSAYEAAAIAHFGAFSDVLFEGRA